MSRQSGFAQKQVILGTKTLLIWFQPLFENFSIEQLHLSGYWLLNLRDVKSTSCKTIYKNK